MTLLGSAADTAWDNLITATRNAVAAEHKRVLDLTEVQAVQIQDLRCQVEATRSTPCQS